MEIQDELNKLYLEKAEGTRIRSKSKWLEQGEKNTTFFHRLEKQRQSNKNIEEIKNIEGHAIVDDTEMLNECTKFYETLYQSNNVDITDIHIIFGSVTMPKMLNTEQSKLCDGHITLNECYTALKLMGKNKSSGLDGIAIEFYFAVWDTIGPILVDCFNESFDNQELSDLQKCAVLSLIFKKGDCALLNN